MLSNFAADGSSQPRPLPVSIVVEVPSASVAGGAWIEPAARPSGRPLVVGLHGGGFGHSYFNGLHPLPVAAARHGADTILLDRPGAGESRFHRRKGDILADNAEALDEAIAELWGEHGEGRPGIYLVGHSIGGAIALLLAAHPPAWPLIGVSVSGIGRRPPATLPFTNAADARPTQPPLPREALAHIMMAPGAATEAALDALQVASVPAVTEELAAIYTGWPAAVDATIKAISRPVQMIVAEHDPLWIVDRDAVDELRRLNAGDRSVVLRWPDVGHCIDYHPAAPPFHDAMFAFMTECLGNG